MPSLVTSSATTEYVPRRAALYRTLLAAPGFELGGWIDALLQKLPFRLGETAAETSIPYAFDDAFVEAAEQAVEDLGDLIRRRRDNELEPKVPAGAFEGVTIPKLAPAGLAAAAVAESSLERSVAFRAAWLDPAIDGAVLEAWIARSRGAALLEQLCGLASKACHTDIRNGGTTAYLALVALAAVPLSEAVKTRAQSIVNRLFPWERVEKAVGFALLTVVEIALSRALASLEGKQFPFDAAGYALKIRALANPLAYCSVRKRALQNDLNPWQLPQALADSLDGVWTHLLEQYENPRLAEANLAGALARDRDLSKRAAQMGALIMARRAVFDWLVHCEAHDPELSAILAKLFASGEALYEQLAQPKDLLARVAKHARSRRLEAPAQAASDALTESLKKGTSRDDAIPEVAAAYACLALDRAVASEIDGARARLRDRRSEQNRDQLIADFLAGKLYRLSADNRELRRSLQRKTQGHLFIDLKNFTQRTYRAKEIVMADFLRSEFYEPILEAAAELASTGQVQLQNLLGDAAVFSGEMPVLVELAARIQKICRAYDQTLRQRTAADASSAESRRNEIETRLRARLAELQGHARQVEAEVQRKLAQPPAELERLVWSAYAHRGADLEARYQQASAQGQRDESARALEALQSLRAEERHAMSRVEQLAGGDRERFVAELAIAQERRKMAALERSAAEARRAAQAGLRAIEDEVRANRGYGLEAGLFITYGAAAELAAMNTTAFGQVKVAIAEKINEAARGTARNGTVKSKLDAMLFKARADRSRPNLEFPFRVYVDSAYNLLLPADLNELIDRAVREREPDRAREGARRIADAVLRDLARAMGVGDGSAPELLSTLSDIYNTGEALAAEALAAYLSATASQRFWYRKTVSPSELAPEFSEHFLFISDEVELIVSVPQNGDLDRAMIFRRAGQVQFKGFEAKTPTTVWEMLMPDSPFCRLLRHRHLSLWTAEAKANPVPQDPPG